MAERLARTRGLVVHPDEVMTTAGTTDALRHLLLALPDGAIAVADEVTTSNEDDGVARVLERLFAPASRIA